MNVLLHAAKAWRLAVKLWRHEVSVLLIAVKAWRLSVKVLLHEVKALRQEVKAILLRLKALKHCLKLMYLKKISPLPEYFKQLVKVSVQWRFRK